MLDDAHLGDIEGALGRIRLSDKERPASRTQAQLLTLLAIVGAGVIVMVGDNDPERHIHVGAGRPELRVQPAVDVAAADPGARS